MSHTNTNNVSHHHVLAAKSFTRQGIGGIAKALKAIPVVRPEDNETKGRGFLISDDKNVTGSGGTQFLADFKKGSLVVVKHPIYGKLTGKVTEVVSDTQMVLAGPFQGAPTTAKPSDGEEKSFNRAMSVRTTVVMVCVFFLPFAYALPPFLPDHWWPLVYMISFQMACGFTNLLYLIYRSEDSELDVIKVTARSSLTAIGSMVRGNATKDTPRCTICLFVCLSVVSVWLWSVGWSIGHLVYACIGFHPPLFVHHCIIPYVCTYIYIIVYIFINVFAYIYKYIHVYRYIDKYICMDRYLRKMSGFVSGYVCVSTCLLV